MLQAGAPGELTESIHAAGYAVREERRRSHRLSGIWRRSDQSGHGSRLRVERRGLLGPTRLRSLSESPGQLRPRGNLRQARHRHVGSGRRASRPRSAHGRSASGDGRRRHGAGGAARDFGRRAAVRSCSPQPTPTVAAHWSLYGSFSRFSYWFPTEEALAAVLQLCRAVMGHRRQRAEVRALARK